MVKFVKESTSAAHNRMLMPLPALREQSELPDGDKHLNMLLDKRKKFRTRQDFMIHLLRRDLGGMEALPAVRNNGRPLDNTTDNDRAEVFSSLSTSRVHRRRGSLHIDASVSQKRRNSLGSEDKSGAIHITEHELRKIAILQSLTTMGVQIPNRNRKRRMSVNEVSMYDDLALRKKKSLTTRMLGYTTDRSTRPRRRSAERSQQSTPEVEPRLQDIKVKTKRIVEITGKKSGSTVPVPVVPGIPSTDDDTSNFRRKLITKRESGPFRRFRRLTRFILVLLRVWRIHSQSVSEILGFFDILDAMSITSGVSNLMFDVAYYKASKQSDVSTETRRILEKNPLTRTADEVHHVQMALRVYRCIAEYPVKMQKLIAQRAWLESYDTKRVIVLEGHIARGFYFILNGSAIVSVLDPLTRQAKTVLFLGRGDSFGEQAIMTQSRRQTTVISRDKIELLVMSDTDFVDIFMSGGLRDPNDPFLRSIDFLEGWPIEKLASHPKKAILSYFKRGTILVSDSKNSEWLFVVKSGSCSILKKLHDVNARKYTKPTREFELREQVMEAAKNDKYVSHEDQIEMLREEETKQLEQKNHFVRFYALPEINIATNAAYRKFRKLHDDLITQNPGKRATGNMGSTSSHDADTESLDTEGDSKQRQQEQAKKFRKMSVANLQNLVAEGPYLKPKQKQAGEDKHASSSKGLITETKQRKRISMRSHTPETISPKTEDKPPTFIEIRVLEKGMSFGVEEMIFDHQPEFSLVSNGVEVIMVNKKFFQEYLNNDTLVRIKERKYPYPRDDDLRKHVELQLAWDGHKNAEVTNTMRDIKLKRVPQNDARATLGIPRGVT